MSLIFPLPSLIPTPPPHPAARTTGLITIGPNFIFFLAPWLLAHSRCTLKMFWCVNEWVGNAVQASHQADTLYLQALHFARVPLRNLTRLERVEEKGGHSGAAHSCQHIFNAYNLKEQDCVFWEVTFFSFLNFWCRLCNSVVGKQPIAVLPPSKLSPWLSGNSQGHTLPWMKLNGIELLRLQIVIFWSRHSGVWTYDWPGLYHSACMGYYRSLMLYDRVFMDLSWYAYRVISLYDGDGKGY